MLSHLCYCDIGGVVKRKERKHTLVASSSSFESMVPNLCLSRNRRSPKGQAFFALARDCADHVAWKYRVGGGTFFSGKHTLTTTKIDSQPQPKSRTSHWTGEWKPIELWNVLKANLQLDLGENSKRSKQQHATEWIVNLLQVTLCLWLPVKFICKFTNI